MEIGNSLHRMEDSSSGAREFFVECAKLDVELKMIHWILERLAGDAPSYESLQQWQNGSPPPPFTPFPDWLDLIRLAVGEDIVRDYPHVRHP